MAQTIREQYLQETAALPDLLGDFMQALAARVDGADARVSTALDGYALELKTDVGRAVIGDMEGMAPKVVALSLYADALGISQFAFEDVVKLVDTAGVLLTGAVEILRDDKPGDLLSRLNFFIRLGRVLRQRIAATAAAQAAAQQLQQPLQPS